jgi:hypothetical protein
VFVPMLPISGANGGVSTEIFSYFHTINLLGRSANFDVCRGTSFGTYDPQSQFTLSWPTAICDCDSVGKPSPEPYSQPQKRQGSSSLT